MAEEDAQIESGINFIHKSILVDEVFDLLKVNPAGILIDGTVGLGGHSKAFLKRSVPAAKLIAIDRDPNALKIAKVVLDGFPQEKHFFHACFDEMSSLWSSLECPQVDAVLLDLGVSSMQLDDPNRGFAFKEDAPLDMRMNPTEGRTAYDLIQDSDETLLSEIILTYGQDPWAKRIARSIVYHRRQRGIKTTRDLAFAVLDAIKKKGKSKIHPATRTFQAIRIYLNRELEILERLFDSDWKFLKTGGRVAIISFHSLEDKMVKHFARQSDLFKQLTKQPIQASQDELEDNLRARSAKLRVLEKVK